MNAEELRFYTSAEVAALLRLNAQVVARKLQAGEIPAYKIGREWRVERSQLLAWLARNSNRTDPARAVLDTFLTAEGTLRALPAQRSRRRTVLQHIAAEFEPNRTYPESEVNAIVRRFHEDVATIRRELIAEKLLIRKAGTYKRTGPTEPALRRG